MNLARLASEKRFRIILRNQDGKKKIFPIEAENFYKAVEKARDQYPHATIEALGKPVYVNYYPW